MKTLNGLVLVSAIILFGSSSCVKKIDQSPPGSTTAVIFSEINAPENFKWATTKKINFSFNGLSTNEYELVLRVIDADGSPIIQKLQKANEDYKVIIEVPVHYDSLTVSYGNIEEKLDCRSGSVALTID